MEKKKDKVNFEENISKLETIVRELESGNVALDDALDKFNEAFKISRECDEKLKEVSESLNKVLNKDGNLEEFKIEEVIQIPTTNILENEIYYSSKRVIHLLI